MERLLGFEKSGPTVNPGAITRRCKNRLLVIGPPSGSSGNFHGQPPCAEFQRAQRRFNGFSCLADWVEEVNFNDGVKVEKFSP